nr:hypothetical protein [Tanacetum cinerariifolium]
MIPYLRFTKLIVSHYMTTFPKILRRARDRYHNLVDDVMIKNIFNSGKSNGVGTHRTTSTPRKSNPEIAEDESSAPRKSTKSHKELEATQNVEKDKEHLMAEEIEKLVKGTETVEENVKVASSPLRNDDIHTNLGTREKGNEIEESKNTPSPKTTRSLRTHSTLISSDTEKLQELTDPDTIPSSSIPSSSSFKLSATNHLLYLLKSKLGHYKNLNKNDTEDMYLLIINHKVDDYAETGLLWSLSVFIKSTLTWERVYDFQLGVESYQQQVNLSTLTITFPCIEKYKVFSIVSELVYDIIYKNNKKEKRAMRHQEVYKFCDATLKRVLETNKSYNNDVKYGSVTHNLSKEDVEYLQLFAK